MAAPPPRGQPGRRGRRTSCQSACSTQPGPGQEGCGVCEPWPPSPTLCQRSRVPTHTKPEPDPGPALAAGPGLLGAAQDSLPSQRPLCGQDLELGLLLALPVLQPSELLEHTLPVSLPTPSLPLFLFALKGKSAGWQVTSPHCSRTQSGVPVPAWTAIYLPLLLLGASHPMGCHLLQEAFLSPQDLSCFPGATGGKCPTSPNSTVFKLPLYVPL